MAAGAELTLEAGIFYLSRLKWKGGGVVEIRGEGVGVKRDGLT